MTEQFLTTAVVDALDALIRFLVEDGIGAHLHGCDHSTDITTWDRLAAAAVAAINADYTRKPDPNVVNPTMTREELVAAAESIGMRFPAEPSEPCAACSGTGRIDETNDVEGRSWVISVQCPECEPCGLLTVSALGERYWPGADDAE